MRSPTLLCLGASSFLFLAGCATAPRSTHAERAPRPARMNASAADKLLVISAVYGSGDKFADVTYRVNDLLHDPEAVFWAKPNWLGADPTPGWNKALVIVYEHDGQRKTFSTGEGGEVSVARLFGEIKPKPKAKDAKPKKPQKASPSRKDAPASADARRSDPANWRKLEVLGYPPENRAFVRLEGAHFRNTGYVLWTEGLRLEEAESAGGYVRGGAAMIQVLVFRDGKQIFHGIGPERPGRFSGSALLAPQSKPEAPLLQPGDRVVAQELVG